MFAAHVIATYHEEIIEDRLVLCERPAYVGEGSGVSVAFPGARFRLHACANGVLIGDETLQDSDVFEWAQNNVSVRIRSIRVAELEREPLWNTDIRFPVLMFALLLSVLTLQSASQVIVTHEDKLPARLATWVSAPMAPAEMSTRSNPDFDLGEVARYGVYRVSVDEKSSRP